ncbi:alpha/beta hydrolase [Leptospira sp. 96542]|nr:alpha/beta hydrolase [Leptospira sp. 96542]
MDPFDKLEIIESGPNAKEAKGIIVLWPSTGGNARSFRIRESELFTLGYRLIRFNPPSHGNSSGIYHPNTAIQLLYEYIANSGYAEFQLIGIGHSGGGAALSILAERIKFDILFLLSPILDSVESLRHLYKFGRIEEFSRLLLLDGVLDDTNPNLTILETLSNDLWLQTGEVHHLDFPVSNKRIRVGSLAKFLTNLFLPGFCLGSESVQKHTKYVIFLPEEDHWFPKSTTEQFVQINQLELVPIAEAKDHFFSSAWLAVWANIKQKIIENKANPN